MFKVNSILYGWMDVTIGETGISFSWIEDAKEELDNLFNLKDKEIKSYEFDLEGDNIKITTSKDKDLFTINLFQEGEEITSHYTWNYKEFIKEYVAEMVGQKELYITNFVHWTDAGRVVWDTEDWKILINI